MADIAPIETRYKGYRFRSRLEARWAVFFDALGVPWEYEKQGYTLKNGERYLPDFWLPGREWWWEVKGTEPTEDEIEKCNLLRHGTDHPVVLTWGTPPDHGTLLYCWDLGDSGGASDWVIEKFAWTRPDPLIPCVCIKESRSLYTRSSFEKEMAVIRCDATGTSVIHPTGVELFLPDGTPVDAAYRQARGARFEHGESGAQ